MAASAWGSKLVWEKDRGPHVWPFLEDLVDLDSLAQVFQIMALDNEEVASCRMIRLGLDWLFWLGQISAAALLALLRRSGHKATCPVTSGLRPNGLWEIHVLDLLEIVATTGHLLAPLLAGLARVAACQLAGPPFLDLIQSLRSPGMSFCPGEHFLWDLWQGGQPILHWPEHPDLLIVQLEMVEAEVLDHQILWAWVRSHTELVKIVPEMIQLGPIWLRRHTIDPLSCLANSLVCDPAVNASAQWLPLAPLLLKPWLAIHQDQVMLGVWPEDEQLVLQCAKENDVSLLVLLVKCDQTLMQDLGNLVWTP